MVVRDVAGNCYGATLGSGAYNSGTVWKLAPQFGRKGGITAQRGPPSYGRIVGKPETTRFRNLPRFHHHLLKVDF